ncbi:MAG: ABC transporter ATP-binding protein [Spirochaeta sp.]
MVTVQQVHKSFGEVTAVDNVSFTATPGGVFGLIGPNGAGKTSIIRMIMNIIKPDTGQILFDNQQIGEDDKRRIGYLPEERGLYKNLKVEEMLLYLGRLKGMSTDQARSSIQHWLKKFGLSETAERKIEELSKGMSQKVQFIGSVLHDPQILFFDEPFSGLDPVSSDMLRGIITDLGAQGKTILLSTHIMDHAERICSDIFLINKGKEIVSGPMQEVKNRYGRRSIIVDFDGDGAFMADLSGIQSVQSYPRYSELELAEGTDPNEILRQLVGKIFINRFEIASPSLHKIFVDLVGSDSLVNDEEGVQHGSK